MTDYELNFSLKIEEMLSRISDPAHRCLVVEVSHHLFCIQIEIHLINFEMFELINVLLKRNSELRFVQTLDVDYLIDEAVKLFQQQTTSTDPKRDFYNLPPRLVGGTTGYMVRVIINYLFNAKLQAADISDIYAGVQNDSCKLS